MTEWLPPKPKFMPCWQTRAFTEAHLYIRNYVVAHNTYCCFLLLIISILSLPISTFHQYIIGSICLWMSIWTFQIRFPIGRLPQFLSQTSLKSTEKTQRLRLVHPAMSIHRAGTARVFEQGTGAACVAYKNNRVPVLLQRPYLIAFEIFQEYRIVPRGERQQFAFA